MCGLTAVFHPNAVSRPSVDGIKSELEASLELIKHRGPDSRGTYVSPDARIGLGHVRLAVIDLPTGQQPMSDEDDLIHCVVTGEIYDHDRIRAEMVQAGFLFKSKSDSELVVQLYKRDGINLLFSLRGEFAFVLYDVKRCLLFAARDRFGIKPLYYTISNGRVLFASETKAFMGFGWKAEWDMDSIVHNGDLGDQRTVFKGVFKLASGHLALCGTSGYIRTERYWDLSYPAANTAPASTIDEMILKVRTLLMESVRLRLRADVPLAVYLSGGIDSSSVAGIATHLLREKDSNAKVTAFTLAYIEDETTDESPIAARTAAHLGAEIHMVRATEATLVDVLEDAIWHSEQVNTTFHGAGKILLSNAVRSNGYKVALSGEGSDEIFGGYGWLLLDYLRTADPTANLLGMAVPSEEERREMLSQLQRSAGVPQMSSVVMDVGDSSLLPISAHHILTATTTAYAKMLDPRVLDETGPPNVSRCIAEGLDPRVRQHSVAGTWQSLNVGLYATAKSLMEKIILNQAGDRNDMTNSVESRVAFLDHHFVEYVNTLPPSVKIMPSAGDGEAKWKLTEKWILRQAVKPFVTEELYIRKKIPFNPPPQPTATGIVTPLQVHLSKRITQVNVERLGFFDWGRVKETLTGYLDAPAFPPHGAIDERARMLVAVLSFIVLQERFKVPPATFSK
ncbi:putative asparagine synthase [Mycena galericulata]|nr:putative asparagine synthase [Mycena galericulata]